MVGYLILTVFCFFSAQLERNFYEDDDEVSYTWVREYHWEVRHQYSITLLFLHLDNCAECP
jgi:hypothetical protein